MGKSIPFFSAPSAPAPAPVAPAPTKPDAEEAAKKALLDAQSAGKKGASSTTNTGGALGLGSDGGATYAKKTLLGQ